MTFNLAKDVLVQKVSSEAILLDGRSGQYYELNAVGLDMLEALTESPDFDTALSRLHHQYNTSKSVIEEDLRGILTKLQQKGLIECDIDQVKVVSSGVEKNSKETIR